MWKGWDNHVTVPLASLDDMDPLASAAAPVRYSGGRHANGTTPPPEPDISDLRSGKRATELGRGRVAA